jgi:hypothetical protein
MTPDEQAAAADPSQIIADLQRERDEARSRETAIAEVLQVINSSAGDLASVFQAMVEKALRLCEATRGTLRTYDGENFHLAAAAQGEALALPDAGQGQSSLFRRFIDGEQIVHLADVLNSAEYQSNPSVRLGMDAVRARSLAQRFVKERGKTARCAFSSTPGGPPLLGSANRSVAELRRAGGYRHGERAAA